MKRIQLDWPDFGRGFRAMIPFWLGAAPFAIVYSVAAGRAGLGPLEIQGMSLTVFSGAAQLGIVQLLSTGGSVVAIGVTALGVSLHHLLYGLSLRKQIDLSKSQRIAAAYFLTDSAYGLTVADENNLTFSFLFGAELSMFLVWNAFTALGIVLGQRLIAPSAIRLDFIAPLTFFVLLVLTTKTRLDLGVAVISAATALVCLWLGVGSFTIFLVGVSGALAGAFLAHQSTQNRDNP